MYYGVLLRANNRYLKGFLSFSAFQTVLPFIIGCYGAVNQIVNQICKPSTNGLSVQKRRTLNDGDRVLRLAISLISELILSGPSRALRLPIAMTIH